MPTPKKKIKPAAIIPLVVAETSGNHVERKEAMAAGLAQRDYPAFIDFCRSSQKEAFDAEVRKRFQAIIGKATERLEQKLDEDKIPANILPMVIGILTDKLNAQNPAQELKSLHNHIHIHGAAKKTKDELIAEITGKSPAN